MSECVSKKERRKEIHFIQVDSIKVENLIDFEERKKCVHEIKSNQIKSHHMNADVQDVINGVSMILLFHWYCIYFIWMVNHFQRIWQTYINITHIFISHFIFSCSIYFQIFFVLCSGRLFKRSKYFEHRSSLYKVWYVMPAMLIRWHTYDHFATVTKNQMHQHCSALNTYCPCRMLYSVGPQTSRVAISLCQFSFFK